MFSEVVSAGCLQESNREDFMNIFAPVGLQHILSLRKGCYLKEISLYYGFARLACTRCGLCLQGHTSCPPVMPPSAKLDSLASICSPSTRNDRSKTTESPPGEAVDNLFALPGSPSVRIDSLAGKGSPLAKRVLLVEEPEEPDKRPRTSTDQVALSQKEAEATRKATTLTKQKARWVFAELLYRCIVCGKAGCNGECAKSCYRCGDIYHFANVCTYDTTKLAKILPNKGVCFYCFDTKQHRMVDHHPTNCPLQRRLKRLLFLDRNRKGTNFEEYLRQLYSSEQTFVDVVASYSGDTLLGR